MELDNPRKILHCKFFDTVKREFPKNQEEYFIDNHGKCYKYVEKEYWHVETDEYEFQLEERENIIAIPFTGLGKYYEHDVIAWTSSDGVVYTGVIKKAKRGTWLVHLNKPNYKPIMLEKVWFHSEIIGSSLTNPELLENA